MKPLPFIINFHGIGKPSRAYEPPGEEAYWIDFPSFSGILDFVAENPLRARLQLTFDDGNLSDHSVAAHELRERRLTAAFFVLGAKIGHKGYLSKTQIHELSAEGFEIGSHGLDHISWTQTSDFNLAREIGDSKKLIEDLIGKVVQSASIPFGRYDRRVLRELTRHGYRNIFSSDGGPRLTSALPTPRYTLRRDADPLSLAEQIKSRSGLIRRARTEARMLVRALLFGGSVP